MAKRGQPYLPLYIQDFLTDEKLNECSASATGVYIKIMCILHKSKLYGAFLPRLLPQQIGEAKVEHLPRLLPNPLPEDLPDVKNDFCCKYADFYTPQLSKHISFTDDIIHAALLELLKWQVLKIYNEILYQKRMVKDNRLSIIRSKVGKKGAAITNKRFADHLPQQNGAANDSANNPANTVANSSANTENESRSSSSSINGSSIETDDTHKKAKTNFQISSSPSSEIGRLLMGDEVVIQCANESWQDTKWRKRVCETYGLTAIELKTWMNDFNLNLANSEKQPLDIGRYQNRLTGHIKSQQNKGIKTPSAIDPKNANGGISHYEQL